MSPHLISIKSLKPSLVISHRWLTLSLIALIFIQPSAASLNPQNLVYLSAQPGASETNSSQSAANQSHNLTVPITNLYSDGYNPPDPLESINRPIFEANLWLDDNILYPIAKTYKEYTPAPVDDSISNFFKNLSNVTTGFNLILQGEFKKSGETWLRFFSNSTFGILGLFDIATKEGIPQHETGFNDTLKQYQFSSGPYIVLPFFGPNTPRSIVGRVADNFTNPVGEAGDYQTFLRILGIVDFRADNQSLFELAKSASFDPYDSMRIYFLKRETEEKRVIDESEFEEFEPLN